MFALFTDFGWAGPYVGQMHAVLSAQCSNRPIVDLQHDAPAFEPRAAGHLLAAVVKSLPAECIVIAVVDPGVGSQRQAILLEAGGRTYLGPDNGLLTALALRDPRARAAVIEWQPTALSASFHGRDLFAPAAARLANGKSLPCRPLPLHDLVGADGPERLAEVIYIDGYGNCWTGLPAEDLAPDCRILCANSSFARACTFSDVEIGQPFWYENSAGLVEIAVNQGSAAAALGLTIGSAIEVRPGERLSQ
ncbi:SAM hydrolase/SAM-dependent halogenase family protein [Aquibaculum arenosum]|uniref:SAM-dependent chlorinase/fluorinase n=1 Tax=Aquibaculum arenosum TaxID=3032591 RepID=A0ABT5YPG9_9PROT|nr:SAM-dependent chlorinase/fluorinase [Fodinicurvata sp. CAU 1616]MDF2096868.1 SAM-dependent chlorinase/fluorinase [Fodinicurvata sp. CAU 1616]